MRAFLFAALGMTCCDCAGQESSVSVMLTFIEDTIHAGMGPEIHLTFRNNTDTAVTIVGHYDRVLEKFPAAGYLIRMPRDTSYREHPSDFCGTALAELGVQEDHFISIPPHSDFQVPDSLAWMFDNTALLAGNFSSKGTYEISYAYYTPEGDLNSYMSDRMAMDAMLIRLCELRRQHCILDGGKDCDTIRPELTLERIIQVEHMRGLLREVPTLNIVSNTVLLHVID